MEAVEYDLMDAAEEAMWWYRAMHARAIAAFRAHPRLGAAKGLPVLDAGCGTGGFLRRAGAALAIPMVGLEYNPQAARRAAEKAGVDVTAGSVNTMPFHDGQFGGLFSLDVLCHAGAEPAQMLAECRRVLAPGGVMVLNLPALPWLRSAHDARVFTVRRYTRATITAELQAAGFTDIRARYWNALLLPLMILQRKVLAARADAPSDVTNFPPWLDACLFAATRIEAGMMRAGLRFPAGGSVIVSATRP
ncbi:class I SAM-dependent methyltransferase [Rhodovarius crocodyli]|uniref:Class I SAM-dependent methyltransferase n=1 Tax=Rhodovarius crocodyli TaxID=1979269 RepID=A0A437MG90_9PROT|nr:class I SAM-dependent methyltransferase [Rhodovarius crocodyli]RVT96664.1 class I SAM-dependent methyltransferase [Rhodovarius crocodyli]